MTTATVGKGKYSYRLVQDWAKLPSGETFGAVSALATDSQDRVYVFGRREPPGQWGKDVSGKPPVLIFDRNGKYLSSWGSNAFARPHGFHIANDIVYLTDDHDSVCMKYTLDGKPLQILGQRGVHSDTGGVKRIEATIEHPDRPDYAAAGRSMGSGWDVVPRAAGPFNYPTKMVPDAAGDLYVSDGYRNARVHRFSPEGQLKFSWGEPGKTGRGKFHIPHSLLVREGLVYVCDRENNRIQVFTTEGEHITTWTDLHRPNDIAVDKDGVLCVCEGTLWGVEGSLPRVSVMDMKGNLLARWDTSSTSAHGISVDSQSDIYVGITHEERVDKYIRLK